MPKKCTYRFCQIELVTFRPQERATYTCCQRRVVTKRNKFFYDVRVHGHWRLFSWLCTCEL